MTDRSLHIMLNPSGACMAQCAYCFGPNTGPVMDDSTLAAALDWIDSIRQPAQPVELVLHGGEPLLAGIVWHQRAPGLMRTRFGPSLRLSRQSNLWLLDDAFCDLFDQYDVALGTSLDGPGAINDAQRGKGYFAKTMRGIQTARRHGIAVGVICTFTSRSAQRWREVFDFFLDEGISFSVHGATPTFGKGNPQSLALTPDDYASLVTAMFDYYLLHIEQIRIATFDQLARGMTGSCTVCTFSPCLGRYLAISSDGGIYPCNRFASDRAWRLGMVQERPSLPELSQTAPWQQLKQRETEVELDCRDCAYVANCNGGCAYHAIAAGVDRRDGFCSAYQRIFGHVTEKVLAQVFSEENMTAVVDEGIRDSRGLLRKGALLQVARGGAHPSSTITRAQEAVAAVAIAITPSPVEAFDKLNGLGLIAHPDRARAALRKLWQRLQRLPQERSEAYLHVTYACNLTCSHCYASGSPARSAESMPVAQVQELLQALIAHSFRRIKITGGEPLMHPRWTELRDMLISLRSNKSQSQLVLRTNLSLPCSPSELNALAQCVDHIIVSIDGDQASHDGRRGLGAYARTTENLGGLVQVRGTTRVTLAATLTDEQVRGASGQSVRDLAAELNCDVRFRPLLPLGRAAVLPFQREFNPPAVGRAEVLSGLRIRNSCSLGQNLHIEVDGTCYPCFALTGERHNLGNALDHGLDVIVRRNLRYSQCTVDTNEQCRHCVWRYLCGGSCRIWSSSDDPDSPPRDCFALQQHAAFVLRNALDVLGVDQERWRSAGLPDVSGLTST